MAEKERPPWYEAERQRVLKLISDIEYEMSQRTAPYDERLACLDYGKPEEYIRRYGHPIS